MKYTNIVLIGFVATLFAGAAIAYTTVPTITDGIGFRYENITIGNDKIKIGNTNITKEATFVITSHDSINKEGADFICDGVDDQVEVQSAINLCPVNAKIITMGTLYFSAPIVTTSDGLTIEGIGSKWILANGVNCEFVTIDHNDTSIQDLIIDGNSANQTSGYAAIKINSSVSNIVVTDINFRNVRNAGIKGVGTSLTTIVDGFLCDRCTANHFIDDQAHHQGGLVHLSYAKHVDVGNCRISDVTTDGVKVIRSEYINIHDIDMEDVGAHGVFVGYGSSYININNINMYNNINGLEVVCVEFAGDSSHDGEPKNKYVNVNNVLFTAASGGNAAFYVCDSNYTNVNNVIINIINEPLNQTTYYLHHLRDANIQNCIATGYTSEDGLGYSIEYSEGVTLSNCAVVDSPLYAWSSPPRGGIGIGNSNDISITHCLLKGLQTRGIGTQHMCENLNIESCIFNDTGLGVSYRYSIDLYPNKAKSVKISNCIFKKVTSTNMRGISISSGTSNISTINNVFSEGLVMDIYIDASANDVICRNNIGFVTENSGTDTLAAGATIKTITHGLDVTPVAGDIMIIPMESLGSASFFWIDGYTTTTFNVTTNADPAQDVDFAWKAVVL